MHPALKYVTHVIHGFVRLHTGHFIVCIDPFKVPEKLPGADVIIITHTHGDHYSPGNIRKVMKEDTLFAVAREVKPALTADFPEAAARTHILAPGENPYEPAAGIKMYAVAAENHNHPPGFGIGVVLSLGGYTYYFSGDTDILDKNVPCDVLFCVCDGRFNMPDYLTSAPRQIREMKTKPGFVVPYHFNNAAAEGNGEKLAAVLRQGGYSAAVFPFDGA